MLQYFNLNISEIHTIRIENKVWKIKLLKVEHFWEPNLWLTEYDQKSLKETHVWVEINGKKLMLYYRPYKSPVTVDGMRVYVKNTVLFAKSGENANMFRISNDFWDDWKFVLRQFVYCSQWYSYIAPGHWPDADMLPFTFKVRDFWTHNDLGTMSTFSAFLPAHGSGLYKIEHIECAKY